MNNDTISICIIDYSFSTNFFLRLAKSDNKREYLFIVTSVSSYFLIKKEGYKVILVNSIFSSKFDKNLDLNKTREVQLGILSLKKANKLYSSLRDKIVRLSTNFDNVNLLCWNGSGVIGKLIRDLVDDSSLYKSIFFEISNLKNKVFADSKGTNAQSTLYLNKCSNLKYYSSCDEEKFKLWLNDCINDKKGNYSPPQAKLGERLSSLHILDFIYSIFFGYKLFTYSSVFKKLRIKKKNNKKLSYTHNIPNKFVFFPMQVSTDTQLILNSDVDNLDTLKIILESYSGNIVIKPHPAEKDFNYIIEAIKGNEERVFISNNNTYDLITKSEKVITINSTVGLECLILDKPVDFYGKSFYKFFDHNILKNYVMDYLVNVDFFETDLNKSIELKEIISIYNKSK